jgi:hypothetical protein
MVLALSWCGGAAEVGLLNVTDMGRGPGCHAENTTHVVSGGFLCGPLNSRVGSAIVHATVVSAGWVAWRRTCKMCEGLTATRRLNHASIANFSLCLVQRTKGAVGMSKEGDVSDCAVDQL